MYISYTSIVRNLKNICHIGLIVARYKEITCAAGLTRW